MPGLKSTEFQNCPYSFDLLFGDPLGTNIEQETFFVRQFKLNWVWFEHDSKVHRLNNISEPRFEE